MFALGISENIRFFALFLAFLGKFLMIFKKISCRRFGFFCKDYTWPRVLSWTIPSHMPLFQGWGKTKLRQKRQFEKKRFFRFYAIIAADTGFRGAALEQRKNTTNNKKSKLFKMLHCSFCHFSSIFGHLSKIFWIIGTTFFYFHYFCFKFGRML